MSELLERKASLKRQKAEVQPTDGASQDEPDTTTPDGEEEDNNQLKMKVLVRSQALDGSSPPPNNVGSLLPSPKTLSPQQNRRLQKDASGSSASDASSGLSRESSLEISTDSSGVDLQQFLTQTLTKGNTKDRTFLLKLEMELITFVTDSNEPLKRFPPMSSYQRMLVHRVAAYFGLEHNVDNTGKAVVVNRTPNTRLPPSTFTHIIRLANGQPRQLLRRRPASVEDAPLKVPLGNQPKSKSVDERRMEYDQARTRIFGQHLSIPDMQQQISPYPLQWSSTDSSGYSTDRTRSLVMSRDSSGSNLTSMYDGGGPYAIWVATSVDQIPSGSVIINPQTGSPFLMSDGSLYRHPGAGSPLPAGSLISFQQVPPPAPPPPPPTYVVPQQQVLQQPYTVQMQVAPPPQPPPPPPQQQPQPPPNQSGNTIVLCPPHPQDHVYQNRVEQATNQMQQFSMRTATSSCPPVRRQKSACGGGKRRSNWVNNKNGSGTSSGNSQSVDEVASQQ